MLSASPFTLPSVSQVSLPQPVEDFFVIVCRLSPLQSCHSSDPQVRKSSYRLSVSPIFGPAFHISQCVGNCLAFTCSRVKASVFFSASASTWPSEWRCRSVSAKVSTSGLPSTSPSVSPSVLTFASARGLASVLRIALTFTSNSVSSLVLAYGYASESLGASFTASAWNWPSV